MFIQNKTNKSNNCNQNIFSKIMIQQNSLDYQLIDNLLNKLECRLKKAKNELSKFKINVCSFEHEVSKLSGEPENIENILIN